MGLLNKFKNPEELEKLKAELKSKVGKEENNSEREGITEVKESDKVLLKKEAETAPKEELPRNKKKNTEVSSQEQEPIIKSDLTDESLETLINNFNANYKDSVKDSRTVRLQKANFKALVKLKAHEIDLSKFINLAIAYTLNSADYSKIIKLLKTPK